MAKEHLVEKSNSLRIEVLRLQTKKQVMLHFVQLYQKLQKRYVDLQQNNYTFVQANAQQRPMDLEKQSSRLLKIESMMKGLEPRHVMDEYHWFLNQSREEINGL
jgi:hypothetical protein